MEVLGFLMVVGGCGLINSAFRREKSPSPHLWGKRNEDERLSILGVMIYVVFGLGLAALGLNYIIRYR